MIPSIKQAKKHLYDYGFNPYSTAYVATNEDLRNVLKCMPKDTKRALTVAASGDHPLFVKLYGAKYVDTFDISFNARLIMDIKTKALSLLNHAEYCTLLKNLYLVSDITHINNMPQIIEKLTPFEQKYIKEMRGRNLFDKPIEFRSFSLPTEQEYQTMQQIINKHFNFIWSDIQILHKKLTRTYDFMHLSNIFDYLKTHQNCIDVLDSLVPYTVPGCNICFTCFVKDAETICENFVWAQELQHKTDQKWMFNNKVQLPANTCVIQRIR